MTYLYLRQEDAKHLVITNWGKQNLGIPETIYVKTIHRSDDPIIFRGIDTEINDYYTEDKIPLKPHIPNETILATYERNFIKTIDKNGIIHYYHLILKSSR